MLKWRPSIRDPCLSLFGVGARANRANRLEVGEMRVDNIHNVDIRDDVDAVSFRLTE